MAKCFVGDLAFDVTDGARVRAACGCRALAGGCVSSRAWLRCNRAATLAAAQAHTCALAVAADTLRRRFSEFGELREVRTLRCCAGVVCAAAAVCCAAVAAPCAVRHAAMPPQAPRLTRCARCLVAAQTGVCVCRAKRQGQGAREVQRLRLRRLLRRGVRGAGVHSWQAVRTAHLAGAHCRRRGVFGWPAAAHAPGPPGKPPLAARCAWRCACATVPPSGRPWRQLRCASQAEHLRRAQVVDANQAKSETWLDEEYQLTPKVRDVRDHGACYCACDGRVRSVPQHGVLTQRGRGCCLPACRHPGVGGHRAPRRPPDAVVGLSACARTRRNPHCTL
jgi:hypothetical protein